MQNKSDIVIVGSGVAGCSLAIKLATLHPNCNIALITKSNLENSNSFYAQGGIAAVTDFANDSFELHIQDTLASGGGLSDFSVVKKVVENAPERILELDEYGTNFNRKEDGSYDLALEGGHSRSRIVHAFDHTGKYVMEALIRQVKTFPTIRFFENRFGIEILKNENGKAIGISSLNLISNHVEYFTAPIVVLATGGSGQVYKNTTNPDVATGDGVAMGIKAGAEVSNLNFVQFHPTVFFQKNKNQLYLLTEAIRGFGAYVVNDEGKRFLFDFDKRGELATRDVVSKAIFSELKKSGKECVYLDCRHLPRQEFENRFPEISEYLNESGIKFDVHLIPIVPAAHYQCGGLKVDVNGQTNVEGLFAIGECAETGLHGANRLASNSLLEGLVFGSEIAPHLLQLIYKEEENGKEVVFPDYNIDAEKDKLFLQLITEIKNSMSNHVTIASDLSDLKKAKKELAELEELRTTIQSDYSISKNHIMASNLLLLAQKINEAKIQYEINYNKINQV